MSSFLTQRAWEEWMAEKKRVEEVAKSNEHLKESLKGLLTVIDGLEKENKKLKLKQQIEQKECKASSPSATHLKKGMKKSNKPSGWKT